MGRSDKSTWLEGPGDLREADVEDVPVKGQSVRVRGLPAAFSIQALSSETTEVKQIGIEQIHQYNIAKIEVMEFVHGVIDPQFTVEEATAISEKYGPAFRKVIDKIDELSAIDKEAIQEATARFPASGEGETGSVVGNGTAGGDSRPPVPARAGAGAPDAGGGTG